VRKSFLDQLEAGVAGLPFAEDLLAAYYLLRVRQTNAASCPVPCLGPR